MNSSLHFGTSVSQGQRTLTVSGELDLAVAAIYEQALLDAVAATQFGDELLVDLSDVPFFDVKALRALLRAANTAQVAGIPLRLTASSAVDRVFQLLEIDTASMSDSSNRAQAGSWTHIQRV